MVVNSTWHWEPLPRLLCLNCGFTWTAADLALLQETVAGHRSQNPDCVVVMVSD